MAKVIMNSIELVQRLETLANRKTFYKNKYPYNLCYIHSDGRTSADCNNLYKAILNGYDVNKTTVGYYQKSLSNTGDVSEYRLFLQCTDQSKDFKKLKLGEPRALYMSGHFGGYIGKEVNRNGKLYNVIEATPSFGNGIVYSWVDNDGTRRACKGGSKNGKWTQHGLFTPWVKYVEQTVQPAPTQPKVDVSKYPILKKGSKGEYVLKLQKLLVSKGYDPKGCDSIFGPGCDKAVRQFQKDSKLVIDGCVGPKTWDKLING